MIDVSLSISAIRDDWGRVIGVSPRNAHEIGWRKRMEVELEHLAEHDWLTGLYNRRRLVLELNQCLEHKAHPGVGAVLVLDVDNFKLVNNSRGHGAGDNALKFVAQGLASLTSETDVVARLGGDEFAIVLPEADEAEATELAAEIRSLLCDRGSEPPITVSVGVSLYTSEQEVTADDALVAADMAQYEAQAKGGDQARVFSGRCGGALKWVERIRAALATDGFLLYGQPIVDLRSGEVACNELLIRMLSDDGAIIAPSAFLPTAERFGLIGEIDRWVTERALRLARNGQRVAVNLAGPSIGDEGLLSLVREAVGDGVDPANVIFEITETAAMLNFAKAERFARTLDGMGCSFALDDFGTGFGSFTYLKHVTARYLKIDVDFVRHLTTNETDQKIVKSIVDIAHSLGKQTIAEGVEDAGTLAALKHRGVDYAQGFYLGRPERLSPGRDGPRLSPRPAALKPPRGSKHARRNAPKLRVATRAR